MYLWVVIIGLVLATTSLGVACYNLYLLQRLKKRFRSAFANLDSNQNLAETIIEYFQKLGATAKKLDNLQRSYEYLSEIGGRSIQKTAIVRFNPFRNTGGDQSFVLAMLDNNNSGLLLTSIHSREGTRVYIKQIEYGNSEHALSAEEEQALKAAKKVAKEDA